MNLCPALPMNSDKQEFEETCQEILTSCMTPFNVVRSLECVPRPADVTTDCVLYYVDEDKNYPLTDEEWATAILQARMEVMDTQAGVRTAAKFSRIPMGRSSHAERDLIAERGVNYVGSFPQVGNCIWGNRTHQGHNIADVQAFAMMIKIIVLVWNKHRGEVLDSLTQHSIDSSLYEYSDKLIRCNFPGYRIVWDWAAYNTLTCVLNTRFGRIDGCPYAVRVNMEKHEHIMFLERPVKQTLLDIYGPEFFLDVFE